MKYLLVMIAALLGGTPLAAASFDCAKASTFIEKEICRNPELSLLDEELSRWYREALASVYSQDELRDEQRKWISEVRDRCTDADCLEGAYLNRVNELQRFANRMPLTDSQVDALEREQSESAMGEAPAEPETVGAPQESTPEAGSPLPSSLPAVASPQGDSALKQTESAVLSDVEKVALLQKLKLALLATVGALVLLVVLGASNRVVVFYNVADAWWSVAPTIILFAAAAGSVFMAPPGSSEFAGTEIERMILWCGVAAAALCCVVTVYNAVHYNRSIVLGLIVGVGKVLISVLMAITFVGSFRAVFDRRRAIRQSLVFALVVATVGFLWKLLVNGERVYVRKGWTYQRTGEV